MTASAATPARRLGAGGRASTALSVGAISTFLTVVVVLPLAALLWESKKSGAHGFWQIVSSPEAVAALSPYMTQHLVRFGLYQMDRMRPPKPLTYQVVSFEPEEAQEEAKEAITVE